MRIEIRSDSVVLDGYVNAVARDSRLIPRINGKKFREQIVPGAFRRSLEKRTNVELLLNHDKSRKLGSTKEGNLQLFEDNIGLRAICTVTDSDVIEKARKNELRGWSFGFYKEDDDWVDMEEGIQRRIVKELDLFEVSIVDNTKSPAYLATSIETRDEKEVLAENRSNDFTAITIDGSKNEETRTDKTKDMKLENIIEHIKRLNK